ncbi:hypothetical protein P175DRAFT_0533120 [Aspergillus ochraceoroseus IBT 24754]|uniref:Uncharacterized protein n=1 Tax=Aspergillus ochraceoroseus IBT 24754 TaxID=1392256 RepID=A0A2T5LV31_9EURO|nr:uncharacterized protein P175DRAFT_0533120 [Aspergillus ochraceoroseus IBT 24754]PTU20144.1 hypothetical protein P175DRAFT_0533120 [Aspergillus ochraceoroseus IBT 24754]
MTSARWTMRWKWNLDGKGSAGTRSREVDGGEVARRSAESGGKMQHRANSAETQQGEEREQQKNSKKLLDEETKRLQE